MKLIDGEEIVIVQIAGLIARRIVCEVEEGQERLQKILGIVWELEEDNLSVAIEPEKFEQEATSRPLQPPWANSPFFPDWQSMDSKKHDEGLGMG